MMERAVVLTRHEFITVNDLPDLIHFAKDKSLFDPHDFSVPFPEKILAFEKAMIDKALELSGGNKSAAARMLGISERHLRSRLESLQKREKKDNNRK